MGIHVRVNESHVGICGVVPSQIRALLRKIFASRHNGAKAEDELRASVRALVLLSSDSLASDSSIGDNDRVVDVASALTPDEVGGTLDAATTKVDIAVIEVQSSLRRDNIAPIESDLLALGVDSERDVIGLSAESIDEVDVVEGHELGLVLVGAERGSSARASGARQAAVAVLNRDLIRGGR